eukprot:GHVR01086175.1.p1 GENE.GHVR01086175.1~~GHVR01086175.1.p1  ORF type:complete len:119 (-),score=23.68 GHVR01086175.1:135-491(-)
MSRNRIAEYYILKLLVRCVYDACDYEGTLQSLHTHVVSCPLNPLNLPKFMSGHIHSKTNANGDTISSDDDTTEVPEALVSRRKTADEARQEQTLRGRVYANSKTRDALCSAMLLLNGT